MTMLWAFILYPLGVWLLIALLLLIFMAGVMCGVNVSKKYHEEKYRLFDFEKETKDLF